MTEKHKTAAALLLVLCSGCATSPLTVQQVAVIRNEATARYAFVGQPRFLVGPTAVEVLALAPVAAAESQLAMSGERSSAEHGSVEARSAGSHSKASGLQSETVDKAFPSASAEREHTSRMEDEAAGAESAERAHTSHIEDEAAGAESAEREHASRIEGEAADAGEQVLLAESRQVRTTVDAKQTSESHRYEIRAVAYEPSVRGHMVTAACMYSYSRPSLKKMTAAPKVIVGDRLDFTLQFKNETPLDLAAVEIVDSMPPEVEPLVDRIRLSPSVRFSTDWREGVLVILIPNGVSRGKTLRIHIPTIVREDIDTNRID